MWAAAGGGGDVAAFEGMEMELAPHNTQSITFGAGQVSVSAGIRLPFGIFKIKRGYSQVVIYVYLFRNTEEFFSFVLM